MVVSKSQPRSSIVSPILHLIAVVVAAVDTCVRHVIVVDEPWWRWRGWWRDGEEVVVGISWMCGGGYSCGGGGGRRAVVVVVV